MAPPPVTTLTDFADMFAGAEAKSLRFSHHFARVAQELGCPLLDTATVIVSSPLDGIHFEAAEHAKLGHAVAARVRELIG
jgi:lysophospholipase L1-like esterase